jgi:hypothetical protein
MRAFSALLLTLMVGCSDMFADIIGLPSELHINEPAVFGLKGTYLDTVNTDQIKLSANTVKNDRGAYRRQVIGEDHYYRRGTYEVNGTKLTLKYWEVLSTSTYSFRQMRKQANVISEREFHLGTGVYLKEGT